MGSRIIAYDRLTESREEIAARLARESGATLVPSFDDPHVMAGQGTIGIEQLAEHPVMLTPRGTTFRDALDQELAASGVRLTSAAEVDGLRLLASLAYQGYAPALLPASAVSGYPEGDWSLVHVEGLARRSVGLVRNRRTTPSMPSRAARDVVLEVIREIAPHQPGIHVTLGG